MVSYANAWRYRDWVVSAVNDDIPYDRFLMAQLAGDLMNDPDLLPATGLLGLVRGITAFRSLRKRERMSGMIASTW